MTMPAMREPDGEQPSAGPEWGVRLGADLQPHVARNVELAARCGAPAPMILTVALASAGASSVADGLEFLRRSGSALVRLVHETTAGVKSLAELEPELRYTPELASVRPEVADHEIRGRRLFRDLVGRQSFFQVAALAIAGLELSKPDAELLECLGVNTQLLDVRIWPLTVTRRVAANAGGFARAVLGGMATMLNPNMAVQPVGGFMHLLDRLEKGVAAGASVEDQLQAIVARREKVPGVGRPALGPDERNAQVVELAERFGRDRGRSWQLALQVDEFFHRTKGQHINSAGLQGALMRDMGFSPSSATAMCVLYFAVPILAHAVFIEESTSSAAIEPVSG
jgi:hypothetical protein